MLEVKAAAPSKILEVTIKDNAEAAKNFDYFVNDYWKNKADFIGINYYRKIHVYHIKILDYSSARFVGGAVLNDLHQAKENQKSKAMGLLNDLGGKFIQRASIM